MSPMETGDDIQEITVLETSVAGSAEAPFMAPPPAPPKPRRRSLAPPASLPRPLQPLSFAPSTSQAPSAASALTAQLSAGTVERQASPAGQRPQSGESAAEEAATNAAIREGIEAAKRTLTECLQVQEDLDERSLDLGDEEEVERHMDSMNKVREKILLLETEIRRHEAELERREGRPVAAGAELLLPVPPAIRFAASLGPGHTTHIPEMDVWFQTLVNKNLRHNRKYYLPVSDDVLAHLRQVRPRNAKLRQCQPAELETIAAQCLDVATRLVREQRNAMAAQALEDLHSIQEDRLREAQGHVEDDEDDGPRLHDPAVKDEDLEQKLRSNHSGHVQRLEDMQSKLRELAQQDVADADDADDDEIMEISPPTTSAQPSTAGLRVASPLTARAASPSTAVPKAPSPIPFLPPSQLAPKTAGRAMGEPRRPPPPSARSLARHPNYAGPAPLNWSPPSRAAVAAAWPASAQPSAYSSFPTPLNRGLPPLGLPPLGLPQSFLPPFGLPPALAQGPDLDGTIMLD